MFANFGKETCMEKFHYSLSNSTTCSTKVDVLETGNVPILFSLPQVRILGMTVELDQKGDNIT